MLTVGVTGGAASGKSTVCRMFVGWGARHVDADRLAHSLTDGPGPITERIVARFGCSVAGVAGGIDRRRLADRVFADPGSRRELEEILHPAIRKAIEDEIAGLAASGFEGIVVIEAALLVETGRAGVYDFLLVVESPAGEKVRRQLDRGEPDVSSARSRLAAQAPAGRKLLAADAAIWNDGSPETLAAAGREVWEHLLERVAS